MRIVVGISGASGTIYGRRLVTLLCEAGVDVRLTMSRTLETLFPAELGIPCDCTNPDLAALFGKDAAPRIAYRRPEDVGADVASGSFPVDGTVICPASTGLIGRVSVGASTNLLERCCDVALKERRPLVLVPRETPLSTIHLEAMTRLSHAGATILPAAPGFYHRPKDIDDLVDFVVQKVFDRLGIRRDLVRAVGDVSGGLPRGEAPAAAPAGAPLPAPVRENAASSARVGPLASVRSTLEMIRFSHSVFALPFALLSLVLAAGGVPPIRTIVLVVLAMVFARSAAMAFNRVADRGFDAKNPRTAGRHLVTGALSVRFAVGFTVVCSALFVLCAGLLNPTALLLSPAVLAVLLGYSYLKRVTSAAHFGVGLALGLSPLGAWVAGAGGLVGDLRVPLVLGAAVTLWVAGFDVIYACQDADVDRRQGLRALPARLGVSGALKAAAACHALCLVLFVLVGRLAGLGVAWNVAVALAAALLLLEHALVKGGDLARVNLAFFTVNGVVALCLGAAGILDALVR